MKHLIFTASFAVLAALSATDITVKPNPPWKASAPGEFSIDFDGGKGWRSLELKPVSIKPDTYYKLSFDACDSSGAAKTQLVVRNSRAGKTFNHYISWQAEAEFRPFILYFKSSDADAVRLLFNINPGPAAKITVKNPALKEVPAGELKNNLLAYGDFETGNDFVPYSAQYEKSLSVAPSPAFFCGEKSLRMTGEKNGSAEITTLELPAIPGKTVEVKFWARSTEKSVPAHMILDFGRWGGSRHLYKTFQLKIGPEWKEYSYRFMLPGEAKTNDGSGQETGRLRFGLPKSPEAATVYLDNIEYRIK